MIKNKTQNGSTTLNTDVQLSSIEIVGDFGRRHFHMDMIKLGDLSNSPFFKKIV